MICEYERCGKEHSGSYGKGRFCSKSCSSGYATHGKRNEINCNLRKPRFCKTCNREFVPVKSSQTRFCEEHRVIYSKDLSFEVLNERLKKQRLLKEFGHRCWSCGLENWCGKLIPLEMDHVNGNADDSSKENLRILCRNCHGLTDTFSWKNRNKFPVSDRRKKMKKYFEGI